MGKTAVPQIGWVAPGFQAQGEKGRRNGHSRSNSAGSRSKRHSGVGADDHSWAIDVRKSKKFHNGVVQDLGGYARHMLRAQTAVVWILTI